MDRVLAATSVSFHVEPYSYSDDCLNPVILSFCIAPTPSSRVQNLSNLSVAMIGALSNQARRNSRYFLPQDCPSILTIHITPNLSETIPKSCAQKVFASGIWTCPPSARELKTRFASLSLAGLSDSANPWKLVSPVQSPSDAITVVSPTRRLACMILFSDPGGIMPRWGGSGLGLARI